MDPSGPRQGDPSKGWAQRAGPEEGKMRMKPLAADDPMTLWSAAVGDAATAMKEGPLPSQRGRGGMCGRARNGLM